MAADATIRPTHGGYQDAFERADLLPLARELAALSAEEADLPSARSAAIRAGERDSDPATRAALKALKWRFYAQPDFRAVVSR